MERRAEMLESTALAASDCSEVSLEARASFACVSALDRLFCVVVVCSRASDRESEAMPSEMVWATAASTPDMTESVETSASIAESSFSLALAASWLVM